MVYQGQFCLLALTVSTLITLASPSRILLIPVPHYSHVNFFTIAAQTLEADGHDVTVLINDRLAPRVAKAKVKSLVYNLTEATDLPMMVGKVSSEVEKMEANFIYKGYYAYNKMTTALVGYCDQLLGNESVMKKIKDAKYDLAILDGFAIIGCAHYIPYKFGIRHINLGPYTIPLTHAVPSIPFHEPCPLIEFRDKNLSLSSRLLSVFAAVLLENLFNLLPFQKFSEKYVPEKPVKTVYELRKETELSLITLEINCFDFPRVSAPHFRFIGSLGAEVKVEPLPEDLKRFADGAKEGLIIISFGSMVSLRKTLKKDIGMLLNALGRMKERAILQFTVEDIIGTKIPENVLVQEWLPQTDLLGHKNTKLFVSHGGLNGHLEATYLGVPILTFPYQTEQARNGARAEAKGHGKLLKWQEVDSDTIYQAMRELIDDERYRIEIRKCSAILKDLPSAKSQLVFWVNHILKHGSQHLQPLSTNLTFYQFYGLDILAILLAASLILTLISITCICLCYKCFFRCCCRSKVASRQKPKEE